jgi:hypothetical protein
LGGRLSRFLHLELGRKSKGGEADEAVRRPTARFDALEPHAAASSDAQSAEGHLARFRAPDAELLLHEQGESDQPFVRCIRCDVDSGRFAKACTACGADLDTTEQRAFNERLWAERRAQLRAEKAQHRAMEQARFQDIAEAAKHNRAYYEELAQRVGRETRERIRGGTWYGVSRGRWRLHPGILAGIAGIIAVAALATGGTKSFTRALGFVAAALVLTALRWLLRH